MKFSLKILIITVLFYSCDTTETKRDRFFLLGNKALEEKEYDDAITQFSNALKIDSEHPFSYNNRGVARYESGHYYEALQDYNQALLRKPNYYECLQNRARVNMDIGRYEKAIDDLDILIETYPDSLIFFFDKGLALTYASKYQEALEIFKMLNTAEPEDDDVRNNLAALNFYLGKYEITKNLIFTTIATNTKASFAYNTLNQVYIKENKLDSAYWSINKAVNYESNNPVFINNKGYTLLLMDSLESGIKLINESILLDSENMWAIRNKGVYYLLKGDHELAIRYFEKIEDTDQVIDDRYYYWGLAYFEMGDNLKACDLWEKGSEKEILSREYSAKYCD